MMERSGEGGRKRQISGVLLVKRRYLLLLPPLSATEVSQTLSSLFSS